jgi:acetylglutamate kinase
MKQQINVIKVGGAVVEDATSLNNLLTQFAELPGTKVLVHGGGRSATKIAGSLGIESHMVGGRRITDAQMLQVVTMVYAGLVNKNIVAGLQARGVNALGLTGADMDVVRSHKRPLKKMTMDDGTEQMVDFGFVGDVDKANGEMLCKLIAEGVVPVMTPLTHDGAGNLLNTNADTIASKVACALAPYYDVTLTFCFEKKGVLRNPDDDESVIPVITEQDFVDYKTSGVISGGMLPKLENAFDAIHLGVQKVVITRSDSINGEGGTIIKQF